jgi:uncharacterized membrane protein YebE (DUF533 family)
MLRRNVMSLMKSLARVAAGVMLAKGIGAMMKNAQNRQGQADGRQVSSGGRSSGGLLDDLLGSNTGGGGNRNTGSGGLGDLLGQVLGGRTGSGSAYGGPNSPQRGQAQGGLGGILDQLGAGAAAGGLGGVLGGILGSGNGGSDGGGQTQSPQGTLAQKGSQPANDASFGELFNDAIGKGDEPEVAPTPEQNALAGLMLKAMIQAAKADGEIDKEEQKTIMEALKGAPKEEIDFVKAELAKPVDVMSLAQDAGEATKAQVYATSLMAIRVDNPNEIAYLRQLASALGMDDAARDKVHASMGVAPLAKA